MKVYRLTVLLCLLVISSLSSAAQKPKPRFEAETFDASKFKSFPLDIDIKRSDIVPVHFNNIILHDNRVDKSKLGFVRAGTYNADHRFVFEGQGIEYLEKKINKLISPDSVATGTLVIYLNSLWLYQTMETSSFLKKELSGGDDLISNCYINYDVYLQNQQGLKPIGTVDTVLSVNGWLASNCNKVLRKGLISSIEVCNNLFLQQDQFNGPSPSKDLSFPILSEEPRKGIFVTYQEFLANRPSIIDLAAETKAKRRILHSSLLPDSTTAKSWGFCDETGLYMNINKDFYKLNRSQNAFDVLAPLTIEIKNSATKKFLQVLTGALINHPTALNPYPFFYTDISPLIQPKYVHIEQLRYFQLNIRDGSLK